MNLRLFPSFTLAIVLAAGCGTPGPDNSVTNAPAVEAVAEENGVAPSEPVASVPVDPDSYKMGQGDEIAIQVFDEPDLTLSTVVGASGSINYSYLGDIKVAGRSPVELEQRIATLLKDGYLVNPSVNVRVVQYRPFFINGEIRNPGSYSYQPGLTLERAISLAGGLTDRASTRKMYVTRAENDAKEAKVSLSFRIHPGDTITIKEGFF